MTNITCGSCRVEIGNGKGQMPGATVQGFEVVLTPAQAPQLQGLKVLATVNICKKCAVLLADKIETVNADRLIIANKKH